MKSIKIHLRKVIGNVTLTFEEFSTLLTQIKACLNSTTVGLLFLSLMMMTELDSLASQPYFSPCAHAGVISGWGKGRGKYVW